MAALTVFVGPITGMGPGFGWTIVIRGSLEETVDIDGDDPMSATTIAPTVAMRAAITACQGLNRRKKLLLLLVIVVPPPFGRLSKRGRVGFSTLALSEIVSRRFR